ncbi:MAG: SRPBCC family protein [Phycicoccus sp.]
MPTVTNTASTVVRAAPSDAFNFIVAEDTPAKVMLRVGPVPTYVEGVVRRGPWGRVGAWRTVTLDDGSTAREEITAIEPPTRFAYTLSEFSPPFGRLVRGATAEWRFTPSGEGAQIDWRYTLSSSWLLLPAVWVFSRVFYRRYMRRALQVTKALTENPPQPAQALTHTAG